MSRSKIIHPREHACADARQRRCAKRGGLVTRRYVHGGFPEHRPGTARTTHFAPCRRRCAARRVSARRRPASRQSGRGSETQCFPASRGPGLRRSCRASGRAPNRVRSGRQCGAPSPTKAGMTAHAMIVARLRERSLSVSPAADPTSPILSRSHLTAAPATKIEPFKCVCPCVADFIGWRRQQPVASTCTRIARVHQHEAAGAIGRFDHPAFRNRLARSAPPADHPAIPRMGMRRPNSAGSVSPK